MTNTRQPIEQFNVLKQCRYGQMLFNTNDVYIGGSLDLYGEFCQAELELLEQCLSPGDTVVDVGANVGSHTLAFARAVGPTGRVLAFEPQRIVFQTLCANMALNAITQVETHQKAVGSAAGTIVVPRLDYTRPDNFGGLALGAHREGESVPLMRLDDLGLDRCRLIKIDVEGMEIPVLEGAQETIMRCRPYMYVENNLDSPHSDDLIRTIDRLGYGLYWHITPYFNPENYHRNPTNIFALHEAASESAPLMSHNMLCAPRELQGTIEGVDPIRVP